MIENRELTVDDYLAMLRRRLKVILIPALLAPLAGFLVSFAFAPKYTSRALVMVDEQKVPDKYVMPNVVTSPETGILYTQVKRDQAVTKGSVLAHITDFFGRKIAEVTSLAHAAVAGPCLHDRKFHIKCPEEIFEIYIRVSQPVEALHSRPNVERM